MKQDRDNGRDSSPRLSNKLFFRLYQCANMLHKTGTRALEDHDITSQQWAVLGALTRPAAQAGVTVGDLAAYLLVSRQNLAGVLSRLQARHYVERAVDARDNRARLIRLTPKGRALWDENMCPVIAGYYDEAMAGFSAEEKAQMIGYLDRMIGNFRALDPDGSAEMKAAG